MTEGTAYCEQCGARLSASARFCRECGSPQAVAAMASHAAAPQAPAGYAAAPQAVAEPTRGAFDTHARPDSFAGGGTRSGALTPLDVWLGLLAVLLAVDLLLLPWFSFRARLFDLGEFTKSGTAGPVHAWAAIAGALAAGVVVLGVFLDVAADGRRILTRLASFAALVFVGIKFGLDVHTVTHSGANLKVFAFGSWLAVIVAIVMFLVALMPQIDKARPN